MNLGELLGAWAAKYGVETVLERATGGEEPAGASLAALAGLAQQSGKPVVVVVDDERAAERARAVYGARGEVRVAGEGGELPKSDLVLVHGTHFPGDWRAALTELGKHATKLVVVSVENPAAWSSRARSLVARVRGAANGESGWGRTDALAPVLWELGRVREHAFLDVPPLGVRSPTLAPRVAPRHAFVVDVTPRSPQARRRLRLST